MVIRTLKIATNEVSGGKWSPAIFIGSLALSAGSQEAAADMVTDWNTHALNVTFGVGGPPHARTLAYVHGAIYDAVNSIERRYRPHFIDVEAPPGASPEAAAAAAAHGVLSRLIPLQRPILDAALMASLDSIPDGKSESDGVGVGEVVAARFYQMSLDDGASAAGGYVPGTTPSSWRPTMPGTPARLAQWGGVRPMLIENRELFPFPGPAPIDSEAYAEDINEVARIGVAESTERTSEQTATAIFWTVSASVPLNAAAKAASAAHQFDLVDNARLFALLNMTTHDACIVVWGAKYDYDILRPETAIREAPTLGNPYIEHDPEWVSLLYSPAFGDYPSGHTGVVGAGVGVLQGIFDSDEVEVSVVWPSPGQGVWRKYESFLAIEEEVIEARIWAGAHTRKADVDAARVGHEIADYVLAKFMQPM